MPFNIREIKSAINEGNGLFRPSHFRVMMPTIQAGDSYIGMRMLSLNAQAVVAPGLNFMTTDIVHNGYGIMEKRPYQSQSNDFNITFRVDSEFDIPTFFYKWMKKISRFDGSVYGNTNADLFEYPKDFVTDFDIEQFNSAGELINIHTITRAFPISCEGLQLDWSLQNQFSTLTVQFSFHTWTTVMLEE